MSVASADAYKLFLQGLVAGRLLHEKEVDDLVMKCNTYGNLENDLSMYCEQVNIKLQPLAMEVRHQASDDDGSVVVSLVNLHMDESARLATTLNAKEIELFKAAMELIVKTDSGEVTSMDIKNLPGGKEGKMSRQEAEIGLDRLVDDGWLAER
eukprot:Ihof_evm3s643 gene=Ihof_evmTU3s643